MNLVLKWINPLNAELNPICHLLALVGSHHILHVSRVRVNVNESKTHFFLPVALRPNVGHSLLTLEVCRSHTTTHHSQLDSSGRVISSSQRPVPTQTHQSPEEDIHSPSGTRTRNSGKQTAADPRLRPRSQRETEIEGDFWIYFRNATRKRSRFAKGVWT